MTDWTVTIGVPDDEVTPEMMIGWEEELQGFDASVARPRDGEVTVHLHLSAPDAMKATCGIRRGGGSRWPAPDRD